MQALIEELRKRNAVQEEQIADLLTRLQALETENKLLKQKNDFLLHRLFGRASETLDSRQMELLLGLKPAEIADEPKVIPLPVVPRRQARRDRKPRIPENLPTEDIVIDPDEVKEAPQAYRLIGEEITQELDVIPPKYFRRRYIRRKYVSKLERELSPIMAPLPPRLIEGGYASAGLLTDIVLKKYVDHLPLYRQEQILRTRHGIELSRKTMSEWMRVVGDWLKPIYNHCGMNCGGADIFRLTRRRSGTAWRKGAAAGKDTSGCIIIRRMGRSYEWHTGRGADCLEKTLKDFAGTVQCDGYGAYTAYAKNHEGIDLAGCWAHARRKIYEAREEAPVLAGWLLNQIGHLYRIEGELRRLHAGPRSREAVRSAESGMILERIHRALILKRAAHLPRGQMGLALAYALGLWDQLCRFRDDGRLEIDNNGVENAIRPTAVGKKNWLFIGHPEAGERSAILYTLLENCKRLGINPEDYLRDVLTRLPSMTNFQTHELTPANWLASRKAEAA